MVPMGMPCLLRTDSKVCTETKSTVSRIYLGLGSNLGDKRAHLETAVRLIGERIGRVVIQSSVCQTMPWGFHSDNTFCNAAVCVDTTLTAIQVLNAIQRIEAEMGRTRKSVRGTYEDRIIDIDLLFFDDEIINEEMLTVPHPLLQHRMFVLMPMVEIAPDLVHPVLNLSVRELFCQLSSNE